MSWKLHLKVLYIKIYMFKPIYQHTHSAFHLTFRLQYDNEIIFPLSPFILLYDDIF